MKSFLANYIIIPKCGTVREKVFMTRIALGLIAIIFCVAALTYSAFAYFSYGVTSDKTTITAAKTPAKQSNNQKPCAQQPMHKALLFDKTV